MSTVLTPPPPECKLCKTHAAEIWELCPNCWFAFSASVEFSRVRTAFSDWVRRCDEEQRNSTSQGPK